MSSALKSLSSRSRSKTSLNLQREPLISSTEQSMDENEKKLQDMKPLMIEKFPLTLEEIFLEEMEGSDYDFKDIFGKTEEKK